MDCSAAKLMGREGDKERGENNGNISLLPFSLSPHHSQFKLMVSEIKIIENQLP